MPGYWEPHTSSVDFCEPNYLLTNYVAEPHNVWSSLFITFIALVGFFYGNPSQEWCISVMFLVLASVGLGSVGLHASLHWLYQSSDEVPMLWQILTFLHMLWINNNVKREHQQSSTPGLVFLLLAVVQTVLYYSFQQIYAVFIGSVILYTVVIVLWFHALITRMPDGPAKDLRRQIHYWSISSYIILAFSLWVIDMTFCSELTPLYISLSGFTLHVFWHVFAGWGTFLVITNLIVMRMQDIHQKDVALQWLLGFVPVVRVVGKHKAGKQ